MVNRVRKHRVEKLWTQRRLARKARIDESTISLIERGKRNASPLMQERLSRALGVPVEDLFPQSVQSEAAS